MQDHRWTGNEKDSPGQIPFWRQLGHYYYPQGVFLKRQFNGPVWKISIDAHFSCPNIDGTIGTGGCIYCDAKSFSPGRRFGRQTIAEQIEHGIVQLQRRYQNVNRFIAYFQPSTNTHAPCDLLERIYREAMQHPAIVGLAIGTRCDALGDEVLDLLAMIGRETFLSLEIGLQSIHNKTLALLQRGHDYESFCDAMERAKRRKLRLGTHLILGLPGESREEMIETAKEVRRWEFDSIKLHHLYVVRETELARQYEEGRVSLLNCEDYATLAVDFLELQSPETVIERLSGEMEPQFLVAPAWTAEKHAARNAITAEFRRRGTFQGKNS